ncbi:P-loop containing nucleoside triphosphate hydrolase protein, partial [Mycena crocata]
MVGRRKVPASTSKSTKQQTILDLFPKKNINVVVPPHGIPVAPLSEPLPQQPANQGGRALKFIPSVYSPPVPAPIASTSKAAEIIEIVDIESSEPPLKPPSGRTASNKPTSSRSTKPPSNRTSRPLDPDIIDLTSHSESPPISTSQPINSLPKPTYDIFAPRPKVPESQVKAQIHPIFNIKPKNRSDPVSSAKKESEAPFPSKESQHVRGSQTIFSTSSPTHSKRSEKGPNVPLEQFPIRLDVSDERVLRTLNCVRGSSFWEKEQCLESIPSEHKRDHPAIARLAASITSPPDASSSSERLWADRWRPERADGVLGNEENAIFLRDWLRALEVRFEGTAPSMDGVRASKGDESRGAKRTHVMRSVGRPKKRPRRSDDGFIVSDASDYSSEVEGPVDGDDDDDFHPSPVTGGASFDEAVPNLFKDHLANTIILSGPPGSGKTAAVYSCAEELGWEVFEVYPGIGKRNGASLETLIGEVGKNHLVRRTQAKGAFSRDRNEADPDNSSDFGFVSQKLKAGIRQSLILLEEVDVLFKEDASFWPAVIRLIRDCKRAVICTCNDISLIPSVELPLQTTLYFEPCPPAVAGSYLQGLCCAEGHIVDREVLAKMYEQGMDLRHSIHRLQLLCQGFPLGTRPELDHLLDWNAAPRQSVPHADLISFADAYMTRDCLDRPQ